MANRKYDNRMEHQQHPDSGMAIYNNSYDMQLLNDKRVNKMAQVKLMWLLVDFLGLPIALLGILANLGNIKSAVIGVLGIIYFCVRGYFFIRQKQQAIREKELDMKEREIELWNMEQDKVERIRKNGRIK